jgi:hypothetical protein
MPDKEVYSYGMRFVPHRGGRSLYFTIAAPSFMKAYQWALKSLDKDQGRGARRRYGLAYVVRI